MRTRSFFCVAAFLAVFGAGVAFAGQTCEPRRATTASIERGLLLAQRTAAALDASGAQVVVLARAGQDLGRYGVRWSHLGFAYRQGDGRWRVVHKLNHCGSAESALYRQGLGEFFMDDPWRYEAAWAVPRPEVQQQLGAMLQDDRRVAALHHRPYSLVSYAWGLRYQQSNQWLIESMAAAVEPAADSRAKAQAWLQLHAYQPAVLTLGPMTRLGGRMSAANVAFDDHPPDKRFSDRIETVTADSVFRWLQHGGWAAAPVVVSLN